MPTFHFPLGGSTAARTLNCPGWLKASEGVTHRPASPAAVEGSMHHEIMEMCFTNTLPPAGYVGHLYDEGDGQTRTFKKEDYPLSKRAWDTTNTLLDELDIDEFMIEPLVTLIPEIAGGSIDMIGLSGDGRTALVLDYKFGRHIVSAERNSQGLFYVVAAMEDPATRDMFTGVESVVVAIVQPHGKSGLSRWTTNMKTVDEFRADMLAAIAESQADKPRMAPGDHCKYCPAHPTCAVARKNVGALANLSAKSDNELAEAAAMVLAVEAWVAAVKEEIYMNLKNGQPVAGWKLVDKRAMRKWIDADAAEAYLKKKRIPLRLYRNNSFRTAPQVVDALKAEGKKIDLDDFIEFKSSGTTAAPASDEAEGINLSVVPENLAAHVARMNEAKP